HRRQLATRYHEFLSGIPRLILPAEPTWARANWQSYCVRLPEGMDQREVMQQMLDEGIATRRGIMCAHLEPTYSEPGTWRCAEIERKPGGACPNLVESARAQRESIILPLFDEITEEQQARVAQSLLRACRVASPA
ncbi:MAG: DegT/DnrJ/EryC1/StrS family aminotransferase, partial [Candidatus Sulfotelmatobacter sp.]